MTLDLGQIINIRELAVHVLTSTDVWIFYPRSVEFAVSQDGKEYRTVGTVKPTDEELDGTYPDTKKMAVANLSQKARYVRVKAGRYGELPAWHQGYGGADGYKGQAWLFIDEIMVNPSK